MKKFILLLVILILPVCRVFASVDSSAKRNAFKAMAISHENLHNICLDAAKNFRYDNRFANYLRNRCLLYESDRQRYIDAIFPITNNGEDWYKDEYPILKANFSITMNNREIGNLKLIINEYCKYNKYKFTKKDPQACSQQRIDKIFEL